MGGRADRVAASAGAVDIVLITSQRVPMLRVELLLGCVCRAGVGVHVLDMGAVGVWDEGVHGSACIRCGHSGHGGLKGACIRCGHSGCVG